MLTTSSVRTLGATLALAGALTGTAFANPPSLRPGGTPVDGPYLVLAGSLHDHSYDSDGHARGEDIAAWQSAHQYELGLDFGSFTEHSDFFPLGGNSAITDQNPNTNQVTDAVWIHQATLDATYSNAHYTLMRGFEYTSDQENHLNVIGSSNWAQPQVAHFGDLTMAIFYQWLTSPVITDPAGLGEGYGGSDGVGQFNHPDSKGALNFDDYAYNAAAAQYMSTIEIFGDQGYPGGLARSDGGWYWFALSQGWTLGPTMDWDNHYWSDKIAQANPGSSCGHDTYLPCERTLVFATQNSHDGIMAALRARRTAATQYPGLWASLRTTTGAFMGSTIAAAPGSYVDLIVDAGSDIHPVRSVQIISDNGVNPYPYYYGDNLACNATPITYGGNLNPNCLPEELGETSLAESYTLQHEKFVATNGHATRKAIIDTPPAGTSAANAFVRRGPTHIRVLVPTVASTRPDGKHFFYAVVRAADGSRVWTAPIFVTPVGNAVTPVRTPPHFGGR